jgi:hypothetical protein
MNIAIFNSHTLLAFHYETELEIIHGHQEKGDHVVQLICERDLPVCDMNPFFQPEACERCISKRKNGYASLPKTPELKRFFHLTEEDKLRIKETPKTFTNVTELKKLKVDNYEIGYSIASSIISSFRDPNPTIDPKWVERYIIGCLGVYFSMINYLRENPTDIVYAFNGRVSNSKAALYACQSLHVKCLIHERGNSMPFYSLFENTSIHDLKNTQRLIIETWKNADPDERTARATQWFNTRMGGKMENWFSFLEKQTFELPQNWDESKKNILICNSSEDEFASLNDEWKNHLYTNQTDGIFKIINDTKDIENIHIYLRIHPHLAKVNNADLSELLSIKSSHLTIIPASSTISTYKLVQNASQIITFGSTIGMEATFMEKPSILAGKAFYYNLGGTYEPETHQELINLLNQDLKPKPKEIALMFAYFFGTFGIPFKHYQPEDFGKGKFKGKYITSDYNFKLKLIKAVFENKTFPKLSEWLRIRKLEKLTQRYLP